MKETLKVSIGGFAFNIDVDAYTVLETYMESLKKHFKNNVEGDEIIADVESRMSELLQLKLSYPDRIVTLRDAEEIIKTMGSPKDFDESFDDDSEQEHLNEETSSENNDAKDSGWRSQLKNKKLFRDEDNKVVAGVCSGLGHYFRVDPVLIRIGFIAVLLLSNFVSSKSGLISVIIYLCLWLAMPKAKTMVQKISMLGKDPTVEGLENREEVKTQKVRGESLGGKILSIIKGVIGGSLIFCGLVFLIVAICIFYVLIAKGGDDQLLYILPYFGVGITDIGYPFGLFVLIPGFMLIHSGVRCFYRFQTRDIVILCVAFVIWISSTVYLASVLQKEVVKYTKNVSVSENIDIKTDSTTINIHLEPQYLDYRDLSRTLGWYKLNEENQWFAAPAVVVLTDTLLTDYRIVVEKKAYANSTSKARRLAEYSTLNYRIDGASIYLAPQLYGNDKKWDRKFFKVIVKTPKGKTVKVSPPLKAYYTDDEMEVSDLGNPSLEKKYVLSCDML